MMHHIYANEAKLRLHIADEADHDKAEELIAILDELIRKYPKPKRASQTARETDELIERE